jgi:5,6,7,8-tetrahydromethanopterin hydro-lyase
MADRIVLRVGESLVAGGPPGTAAEPEVAIGEMDGPFGSAFANLLGDQVKGHSRVLALLNTDVMVRPLCVSKVTVNDSRYTNILMGTVQYATAMGVLDSVRAGDIPENKVDDLGIRPRHHRLGVAQPWHCRPQGSRSPGFVRHPPQGDRTGDP